MDGAIISQLMLNMMDLARRDFFGMSKINLSKGFTGSTKFYRIIRINREYRA